MLSWVSTTSLAAGVAPCAAGETDGCTEFRYDVAVKSGIKTKSVSLSIPVEECAVPDQVLSTSSPNGWSFDTNGRGGFDNWIEFSPPTPKAGDTVPFSLVFSGDVRSGVGPVTMKIGNTTFDSPDDNTYLVVPCLNVYDLTAVVFQDKDSDPSQGDPGLEEGIAGKTVELWEGAQYLAELVTADGSGDQPKGSVTFQNLVGAGAGDGPYTLRVPQSSDPLCTEWFFTGGAPAAFFSSPPASCEAADIDATVPLAQDDAAYFGFSQGFDIGGAVYIEPYEEPGDTGGSGDQNAITVIDSVTVQLFSGTYPSGTLVDSQTFSSVSTDFGGACARCTFLFEDLPGGVDYYVLVPNDTPGTVDYNDSGLYDFSLVVEIPPVVDGTDGAYRPVLNLSADTYDEDVTFDLDVNAYLAAFDAVGNTEASALNTNPPNWWKSRLQTTCTAPDISGFEGDFSYKDLSGAFVTYNWTDLFDGVEGLLFDEPFDLTPVDVNGDGVFSRCEAALAVIEQPVAPGRSNPLAQTYKEEAIVLVAEFNYLTPDLGFWADSVEDGQQIYVALQWAEDAVRKRRCAEAPAGEEPAYCSGIGSLGTFSKATLSSVETWGSSYNSSTGVGNE